MAPILASITPSSANVGDPSFTMTIRGVNFTSGSRLVFGGTTIPTTFVDANLLLANVPSSAFATFSLGGVNVQVQDGTGLSNSATFSVSKTSPVSVSDLLDMINSISVPDLSQLTGAANPFLKKIDNVQVYRIRDGDTIQSIAQRLTGDTANWSDIAFINNLRYPFVSNDPTLISQQNTPSAFLTQRANPGDMSIRINGANVFIAPGSVLFFLLESPLTDGTVKEISDIVTVDTVIVDTQVPTNTIVRLQSPVFNTYLDGTQIDVLQTISTTTRVATTGSYILVPAGNDGSSLIRSSSLNVDQAYNVLGQDFWLDNNGLLRADSSGDVQTVLGVPNLTQAIQHRLLTELGELDYYPQYGNVLLTYVGHLNAPVLAIIANSEIERTLLNDPRVKAVRGINVSIVGDTLSVRANIEIDLLNTTQDFNFVLPVS